MAYSADGRSDTFDKSTVADVSVNLTRCRDCFFGGIWACCGDFLKKGQTKQDSRTARQQETHPMNIVAPAPRCLAGLACSYRPWSGFVLVS
jgi:hypothetical protein